MYMRYGYMKEEKPSRSPPILFILDEFSLLFFFAAHN